MRFTSLTALPNRDTVCRASSRPMPKSLLPEKPEGASAQARTGADGLADDLSSARRDLLAHRHPAYHRIVGTLIALLSGSGGDEALVARFERAWRTRSFPTFYERPLLILAALRADALEEGHAIHSTQRSPSLHRTPRSSPLKPWRARWARSSGRLVGDDDPACTDQRPEPRNRLALAGVPCGMRRSAAAARTHGHRCRRRAELNRRSTPANLDRLATGKPISCATRVNAVARVGFDSRPLNVQRDDDVLWMRSCIWPGETDRLARFEAAVLALRAAMKRHLIPFSNV